MTKKKEGKERKPNWKEYTATVEDIEEFLSNHVFLRHNMVTGRVECRIPENDVFADWIAEGLPTEQWLPISDRIVNTLWRALSKTKMVSAKNIYQVIESDFSPDFHPFRYYLEHLPPWNGEDHILAMSVSVSVKGEMEQQMLFADYLKKWLVGMVAGWIDPSVVNNVILVLIGEQGSYKTTWFNHLLPPELRQYFYTKTNANRMGRDDLLTLAQYGLVCCEELDTMRPSELNQLKAAVTMPSIDERAAYAHYHEHRPHIASFCGTGNNTQFLSDPTGNRRWLPFEVESITSPREVPFEYEGIYSQVYYLYRNGFEYWFSGDETAAIDRYNSRFKVANLERQLVYRYYRLPSGTDTGEFVDVGTAMHLFAGNMVSKLHKEAVDQAFIDLGFEATVIDGMPGYLAVRRLPEEINALGRQMAVSAKQEPEIPDHF